MPLSVARDALESQWAEFQTTFTEKTRLDAVQTILVRSEDFRKVACNPSKVRIARSRVVFLALGVTQHFSAIATQSPHLRSQLSQSHSGGRSWRISLDPVDSNCYVWLLYMPRHNTKEIQPYILAHKSWVVFEDLHWMQTSVTLSSTEFVMF